MSDSNLYAPHFHNEEAAYTYVEARLWPHGAVCPHCGSNHLNRYLAEFDFRYNNRVANGVDDSERDEKLLLGVKGKRLTYQTTAG